MTKQILDHEEGEMSKIVPAVLFYCVIGLGIQRYVNTIVPNPYMDEIFHGPQTGLYCNGTFSRETWDPKITTLPGTYLTTSTVLNIFAVLQGREIGPTGPAFCTLNYQRGVTFVFSVFNLVLIYKILFLYMPGSSWAKKALAAFNIATFPVLYFFSFLYYTDTISTFYLLLMHVFYLKGYHRYSAITGVLAIFTRQTNIVWVFFHGLVEFLSIFLSVKENIWPSEESAGKVGKSGKPKPKKTGKNRKLTLPLFKTFLVQLFAEVVKKSGILVNYLLVGIGFAGFVVYNGGVAVGDKDAHQVKINLPQMGYFTVVYGFFTAPFVIRRLDWMKRFVCKYPVVLFLGVGLSLPAVYFNSVAHPYLLADNRHYTFYLWKNLYKTCTAVRLLLVVPYVAVWTFIWVSMGVKLDYRAAFFLSTFINLVPQTLLEFRYFIPAYLFARMTMKDVSWKELASESALNAIVNGIVFYNFLYRPFKWDNSEELQRFMW